MKNQIRLLLIALVFTASLALLRADAPAAKSPVELFSGVLTELVSVIDPTAESARPLFSARLELTRSEGLPKDFSTGLTARLEFQSPDRLQLHADVAGRPAVVGRDGQELWVYLPTINWGVVGKPGEPRFLTALEKKDQTRLKRFKLPLPREQLALAPLLFDVTNAPDVMIDQVRCFALLASVKPEAQAIFPLPSGTFKLWVRQTDLLPLRLGWTDGKKLNVEITLHDVNLAAPAPSGDWKLPAQVGDKIETTALGHLVAAMKIAPSLFYRSAPILGPVTGARHIIATNGLGRLEERDETKVMFLQGTPEQMGEQHGRLLAPQIKEVVTHILYGIGVGSSFKKGRWFFGEIEEAQRRLNPFIDARYLREMDALALAAGMEREEIRLANYFPEMFHCTGFALFNEATAGKKIFHGRILDYLSGVGLEQNAVVIVSRPEVGNAWVNIGYAGFVGSVTAMNEKHLSIGEMGGHGQGHWDGKPMSLLVREVMEKASTLDEAVAIMRRGPRTCEYYYVIADGKTKTAVGIAATPETFEVIQPGQVYEGLPEAVPDAVLMSSKDRYVELVRRVKAGHGKFTAESARELMSPPVCMKSNIHSVLFDPETLDFWVANADAKNVASETRYTQYNLAELLKAPPQAEASGDKPRP